MKLFVYIWRDTDGSDFQKYVYAEDKDQADNLLREAYKGSSEEDFLSWFFGSEKDGNRKKDPFQIEPDSDFDFQVIEYEIRPGVLAEAAYHEKHPREDRWICRKAKKARRSK